MFSKWLGSRDKPTYWHPSGPQPQGSYEIGTTATSKDGRPALVFSYTTGHTFTDIPLPDATFWGLPYARIPSWEQWLRGLETGGGVQWEQKQDTILWVGTTGVGNGKLGFSSHPLRSRFERCGPEVFGSRLVMHSISKEEVDKLAWKKPPCAPKGTPAASPTASAGSTGSTTVPCDDSLPPSWITLREQCRHRIIVHLPGVSDWLEHFKHQLSCGSLNIYVTEEREQRRRDLRREAEVRPPLTPPIFEHFDWWAPLLQAGVHYVHVTVPKRKPAEVCATLKKALIEIEATPGRDRCIAEHGQRLARSLTMDRVHAYLADVLRGAAAVQKPKVVQELAEASGPGFVNLVTKRNLLRHVSESTRPWIEYRFLPSLSVNRSFAGAGAGGSGVGGSAAGRRRPFVFSR